MSAAETVDSGQTKDYKNWYSQLSFLAFSNKKEKDSELWSHFHTTSKSGHSIVAQRATINWGSNHSVAQTFGLSVELPILPLEKHSGHISNKVRIYIISFSLCKKGWHHHPCRDEENYSRVWCSWSLCWYVLNLMTFESRYDNCP